jgi:hypothetical protein
MAFPQFQVSNPVAAPNHLAGTSQTVPQTTVARVTNPTNTHIFRTITLTPTHLGTNFNIPNGGRVFGNAGLTTGAAGTQGLSGSLLGTGLTSSAGLNATNGSIFTEAAATTGTAFAAPPAGLNPFFNNASSGLAFNTTPAAFTPVAGVNPFFNPVTTGGVFNNGNGGVSASAPANVGLGFGGTGVFNNGVSGGTSFVVPTASPVGSNFFAGSLMAGRSPSGLTPGLVSSFPGGIFF